MVNGLKRGPKLGSASLGFRVPKFKRAGRCNNRARRFTLSGIPNKKRRNRPVTRLWTDASYLSAILRIAPRCDPRRGGTFPAFPVSNTPVFPPSSYRNSHSVPDQGFLPIFFLFLLFLHDISLQLFFQANRRWSASRGEEFHIRNPRLILSFWLSLGVYPAVSSVWNYTPGREDCL